MKTNIVKSLILLFALFTPLHGYSADADNDRSSAKRWVKDSVITTKIKAEFAKDKSVSATKIRVDTDNAGVVQLSGTAKSQAEADRAVSLAQGVEGVTTVENKIQVDTMR